MIVSKIKGLKIHHIIDITDMDHYYSEPDTHSMVGSDIRDLAPSSYSGLEHVTLRWHGTEMEHPQK